MSSFRRFAKGTSNPVAPALFGQGQEDSSSTHSWIFLLANVARTPNARSLGVAASTLARSLPEGEVEVKASRVVVGERSERISSVMR